MNNLKKQIFSYIKNGPNFIALAEVTHLSDISLKMFIIISKFLAKNEIITTFSMERLSPMDGIIYNAYINNQLPKHITSIKVIKDVRYGGLSSARSKEFPKFLDYLKKINNKNKIAIIGCDTEWFWGSYTKCGYLLKYILPKSDYNLIITYLQTKDYKKLKPTKKYLLNYILKLKTIKKKLIHKTSKIIIDSFIYSINDYIKQNIMKKDSGRNKKWYNNLIKTYEKRGSLFILGFHLALKGEGKDEWGAFGNKFKQKYKNKFESWGMGACKIKADIYLLKTINSTIKKSREFKNIYIEKYIPRTSLENKVYEKSKGYAFINTKKIKNNEYIRFCGSSCVGWDINETPSSKGLNIKELYNKVIIVPISKIMI